MNLLGMNAAYCSKLTEKRLIYMIFKTSSMFDII